MPTATSVLQASLENHNEAFESLLKLIPAKYYLVNEDAEAQASTPISHQGHSGYAMASDTSLLSHSMPPSTRRTARS